MMYVCKTAVDLLADSSKFPNDWLFNHRWGKGKKDAPTALPSGARITFLTVGGRTSCVVPSVQKKTGAVAGDITRNGVGMDGRTDESTESPKVKKRKGQKIQVEDDPDAITLPLKAVNVRGRKVKSEDIDTTAPKMKKRKVEDDLSKEVAKKDLKEEDAPSLGRRRSGRVSKGI
jgi:formamidopyrimidine-DNA glycosylase